MEISRDTTQRLAITPGEPAGIGPELVVRLAQQPTRLCRVVIGDAELLQRQAKQLGLPLHCRPFDAQRSAVATAVAEIECLSLPMAEAVVPGLPKSANATALLAALDTAVAGCLCGDFAALLTGPLHKAAINQAGHSFSGHTQYLAQRSGSSGVVMLLAAPRLKLALVTDHIPLQAVSAAITDARLQQVVDIVVTEWRRHFAFDKPRIAVCGLNPHAGEGGFLGDEEKRLLQPFVQRQQREGHNVQGPFSADGLFHLRQLKDFDVVISMYHDQALPVIKSGFFGVPVNMTLGLPFMRCSVGHGTALELAGHGMACIDSMLAAEQQLQDMLMRQQ